MKSRSPISNASARSLATLVDTAVWVAVLRRAPDPALLTTIQALVRPGEFLAYAPPASRTPTRARHT